MSRFREINAPQASGSCNVSGDYWVNPAHVAGVWRSTENGEAIFWIAGNTTPWSLGVKSADEIRAWLGIEEDAAS